MMLVVMYSKGLNCLGLVRFVRGLEGIEGNNYFPTDVRELRGIISHFILFRKCMCMQKSINAKYE